MAVFRAKFKAGGEVSTARRKPLASQERFPIISLRLRLGTDARCSGWGGSEVLACRSGNGGNMTQGTLPGAPTVPAEEEGTSSTRSTRDYSGRRHAERQARLASYSRMTGLGVAASVVAIPGVPVGYLTPLAVILGAIGVFVARLALGRILKVRD